MTAAIGAPEAGEFAALRALAEKATPGPWTHEDVREIDTDLYHIDCPGWMVGNADKLADAAYIAAANPSAILSLLDTVATLTARIEAGERRLADGAVQTLHAAASDLQFVANGGTCAPRTLIAHADELLELAEKVAPDAKILVYDDGIDLFHDAGSAADLARVCRAVTDPARREAEGTAIEMMRETLEGCAPHELPRVRRALAVFESAATPQPDTHQ